MRRSMLHPLLRAVTSRTRSLKRAIVFGANRSCGPLRRKKLKPQKLPVLRSVDFALFFVKLKAQAPFDEAADGAHRSVPCALAANVNVAVVGVAAEPVTPLLQFLVELVEHDVGQQGRERPALRRALVASPPPPLEHHSGSQVATNQVQDALVLTRRETRTIKNVVVDPVKELGQIHIHDPVVSRFDILARSLIASCAPRPGRNPKLNSLKVGSKIGVNT